jgi:hypothetical protein
MNSASPREVGALVVLVKPLKTFWSSIHSTPMFPNAQFPRGRAALESAALLLNCTGDTEPASALQRDAIRVIPNTTLKTRVRHHVT